MRRLVVLPLAFLVSICWSDAEIRAQAGLPNPYGGHSMVSGVQLLGIEPEAGGSGVGPRSPLDGAGRIRQVQYPLDNRAYEGPSDPTPSGYPMYAPGVTGIAGDGCESVDESWFSLGKIGWEATWLAGGGDGDAMGLITNEWRAKVEFPQMKMLAATPRFAWNLVDGPIVTDLPGQLYDGSIETVLSLPLRESLFMQAAISPSYFTDGQNLSGDAFRLPGRLLVFWNCTDTLTLSGGVVYLDREDVGFLPSAGLIYKPSEDWKYELIIPRPRIAWRYSTDGDVAQWAYVVGEFGGGSWAIERSSGIEDVATLSDYRLLLGWEQTRTDGIACRFEGGYVFNRSLEYLTDVGNRDLPATALVRFAVSY